MTLDGSRRSSKEANSYSPQLTFGQISAVDIRRMSKVTPDRILMSTECQHHLGASTRFCRYSAAVPDRAPVLAPLEVSRDMVECPPNLGELLPVFDSGANAITLIVRELCLGTMEVLLVE